MIMAHMRGHEIYLDGNDWRYKDNNEICIDQRPCKHCGEDPTPEGYDACLGYIKDVAHACCGHGIRAGYLIKKNGHHMTLPKRG